MNSGEQIRSRSVDWGHGQYALERRTPPQLDRRDWCGWSLAELSFLYQDVAEALEALSSEWNFAPESFVRDCLNRWFAIMCQSAAWRWTRAALRAAWDRVTLLLRAGFDEWELRDEISWIGAL